MKDFTMSMYASEKDLYKPKAEYYEKKLEKAKDMLVRCQKFMRREGYDFHKHIAECLEKLDE